MPSSRIVQWRNFRLTPIELLIIVLTILGIIFLVSTWSRNSSVPNNNTTVVWEESGQAIQLMEQMREEISALQASLEKMEKRLQTLEQAKPTPSVSSHTVKAGDTLQSIAQEHKLSVDDLKAWNQLDDKSVLTAGQQLRLAPAGE